MSNILMTRNDCQISSYSSKKPPSSKKGSGPMHIIKVALYMLRRTKKSGNSKTTTMSSSPTNAALTKFVGSVRPLYLQGGESPPPPPPLLLPPQSPEHIEMVGVNVASPDWYEQASPMHPGHHARSFSASSGGMSRYTSAQSLYDLDNHDEDDEDDDENGDAYYDGVEGDEEIDAKAEMFIAKFYQQIKKET